MSAGPDNVATARAKPRRKRRWAFVLAALMVGAIVALLLLELAFRTFWQLPPWFAEFQQAGMYAAAADGAPVLQPGYRGALRIGDDVETAVAINSFGMRGPEPPPRQPGSPRVLMVGDSLVFGYGVEAEQALPACVERGLRQGGIAATVGNAGVPGYGTRHAVDQMERLDGTFAPAAFVVCGFLGNDAIDDCKPRRTVYAGLMLQGPMARLVFTSWRTRLALRSRAALWGEAWILTNKPEWSPLATIGPDPEEVERAAGLPPDSQQLAGLFLDVRDQRTAWQPGAGPVVPRLCGYLRESLERAKAIAGQRPLVFVVLPTSWQVDEHKRVTTLQGMGLDPDDYERGLAQQRWLDVAQELGVTALDATPMLTAAGDAKDLFIKDGGHLNVRGNQIVGNWLASELVGLLR